mgnify:FL=1
MKKLFFAGALCMMLCVCATGMAGTMFNVCLSKECLTEQEAANQAIQTKPKGFKVTRQSVIPWDDAGERWSVLVELENVSEEAITIDDTWLIACNARKEELARWSVPAIDGAFWKTNRTVRPGERVVLFAGTDEVKTWIADWETKETVEKTVSPAGLGAVAEKIRQAARLQVRFDARVASEAKGHLESVEAAKAWIADGKLHLETTDTFDSEDFVTLSVIVTDREGRMLDALQDSVIHNAGMQKDGRFSAEKALAPYIGEEMQKDVIFEIEGYKNPQKTVDNPR